MEQVTFSCHYMVHLHRDFHKDEETTHEPSQFHHVEDELCVIFCFLLEQTGTCGSSPASCCNRCKVDNVCLKSDLYLNGIVFES